eukprot:COSAG02_NODE_9967_length_2062_cov_0.905756_3_plen_91_part_00
MVVVAAAVAVAAVAAAVAVAAAAVVVAAMVVAMGEVAAENESAVVGYRTGQVRQALHMQAAALSPGPVPAAASRHHLGLRLELVIHLALL